ncbi:hypothetical protein ASZ90_016635 [hydrocarbon metagenome]|uniref:Uncharacterized protein n=1 Tax=hydrocarbon metagenome TaxID=938273 RepID=A0A0W8ELG9_9ZZZZ
MKAHINPRGIPLYLAIGVEKIPAPFFPYLSRNDTRAEEVPCGNLIS